MLAQGIRQIKKTIKGSPILLFLLIAVLFPGCQQDPPVPKPRTFPRMEFPDKNIVETNLESCPFTFRFPDYAVIKNDKTFFGEKPPHPCWFDLYYPDFNASLYLSYHSIQNRRDYDDLVSDSYKIANKINLRSDYMEEIRIKNSTGMGGIKFVFEGAAASPVQFYMTDSTSHFIKGALYYNDKVKSDSMQPATAFIMADVDLLLSSLKTK